MTAGKVRESFGERETPSRLHALGVSQLLAGRYDDAAESLLAASREQPANARYLNDAATVQLERARLGLRPDDLPRALAAADRALTFDPSLKEAWFNRALAASALSLTTDATTAWTEYLERDSVSPWATEARARLADLAKPTAAQAWTAIEGRLQQPFDGPIADEAVRMHTTEARNFVDRVLIPRWARAVIDGADATTALAPIRLMADALARISGDFQYRDTVAAIDRTDQASAGALRALAGAHARYAEGAALVVEDRFAQAVGPLTTSKDGFAAANSPFADRAAIDLATIAYVRGQSAQALESLNDIRERASPARHAFHAARAAWVGGLVTFGQGQLAQTQANYEDMLAGFERMQDAEGVANAHNLLAVLHDYLGDSQAAWRHRLQAFDGMTLSRSARFKYSLLAAAVPSMRIDSPETALSVQDAAVAIAEEWGREAAIADALAQRASLLASLGRKAEAHGAIQSARHHLENTPDPAFRNRIEVAVLTIESDLNLSLDPSAALAAATRAIDLLQQRRDRLRVAQLSLRVARANLALGRTNDARRALDRGLAAFNEERAASTDQRPISALDESWKLFEAALQLALKEKDFPRAFALSEAARARSTGEAQRYPAIELGSLQAALQPHDAVVALNQFDNELAVWIVRHDRLDVVFRSLSRRDTALMIARQQDDIRREASSTDAGRNLFNEVLRPAASSWKGATRLVVVPDTAFENASFAAFYNSATGHFLVEDLTLTTTPSGAAFAAATAASSRNGAIGQPLIFNGSDAGAAAADAIAASYRSTQRLAGAAASREGFFNHAAGRSIVHLAARTSSNRSYPPLSRFLVSDQPGQPHSGAILGRDLAQRTLPKTSVVVIDEVQGAGSNRGEGTSSLARAFMAAGVPAVLGTLPGADESAVRELMAGFHREMSKGVSAEQALTTIQRNAIQQNGRRVGAWSALVIYGSDR